MLRQWVVEIGRHRRGVVRWLVKELSVRQLRGTIGMVPTLEGHLETLLQRALRSTQLLNNAASVVAQYSEVWVPAGREVDFLEAYRRLWPVPVWCKMAARDPADYMEQARSRVARAYPDHVLVAQRWQAAPSSVVCSFEEEPGSRGSMKTRYRLEKRQQESSAVWRAGIGRGI